MSGNLSTQLDRPYAQQQDTRAAALRRLSHEPDADLLADMLGLIEHEAPPTADGRELCATCGKPLPDPIANGGRKKCQRRACVAARKAGLP